MSLDGKIVDISIYNRAKLILELTRAIAGMGKRKAVAMVDSR